jgi:hypothetical protein
VSIGKCANVFKIFIYIINNMENSLPTIQNTDSPTTSTVPVNASPPTRQNNKLYLLIFVVVVTILIIVIGLLFIQNQLLNSSISANKQVQIITTPTFYPTLTPIEKDSNLTEIPESIDKVFKTINLSFGLNTTPTKENQFYTLSGFVNKESWKFNLTGVLTDKSQFTKLNQTLESIMKQDVNNSADGVGQSVQGYENDEVYCFFLRGFESSDYISCITK